MSGRIVRGGVRVGFLYMWYLYVLLCADGTYYTGITKDTKRRLHEHNNTKRGAKYTKVRRPVSLVFKKSFKDRSAAQKAEHIFKRYNRARKKQIIDSQDWRPDRV